MQRVPTCPSCCHSFGTRDPGRPTGPSYPRLLSCAHTFCEKCLTKSASKHVVVCPSCQTVTPLKEEGSVKSLCPDVYMLGLIALNRKTGVGNLEDSLKFTALDMFKKPQPAESQKDEKELKATELCAECSINEASCTCAQCEVNMCGTCFEKVHKSSKTLRKHQAKPLNLEEQHETIDINTCSAHDNRPIEYFCEDDQTPICSHCVIMGEHKEHAISPLEDKNKEAVSELEPVMQKTMAVTKRMKHSEKVLAETVPEVRQAMVKQAETIRKHFTFLHAALQAREIVLLQELDRLCQSATTPLEEMKKNLEINMRQFAAMLRDSQKLLNNNPLVVNAQTLLYKMKQADDTPCFAYRVKNEADALKCDFTSETPLPETIGQYGKVQGGSPIGVKLLPLNQVPDEMLQVADQEAAEVVATAVAAGIIPAPAPATPSPQLSPSPPADTASVTTDPDSKPDDSMSEADSEATSEGGNTASVRSTSRPKKKKVPTATLR